MTKRKRKLDELFVCEMEQVDCLEQSSSRTKSVIRRRPSSEIETLRKRLKGGCVALLGCQSCRSARRRLKHAFGLSKLILVPAALDESNFEHCIGDPGVTVVLLADHWVNQSYEEVQHVCVKYNKPLVRVPDGYSPNTVAYAVRSQCGDWLRTADRLNVCGDNYSSP